MKPGTKVTTELGPGTVVEKEMPEGTLSERYLVYLDTFGFIQDDEFLIELHKKYGGLYFWDNELKVIG
jgi:hypothetical protein